MEGTPFGRYRLLDLLGRGGMGEVYRAWDTDMERYVAVKVLPAHLAQDGGFRQRFEREAKAAAGLSEPHVISIHYFGEIDGRLYVDMQFIDGEDLESMLRRGPLSPALAVNIVGQVASALAAAHRIGLVHRDIKPSNVLVGENDFAYLIDFGIARAAGQAGLTNTGATIGTWSYMAPERFSTGDVDPRIDVYALACVLFECLIGHKPFAGESLEQQFAGHMTTPPPSPSRLVDGIPEALDAVIAAGMAKNPGERYRSTTELAKAARAAIEGAPTPPRPELRKTSPLPPGPPPLPATVVAPVRERPTAATQHAASVPTVLAPQMIPTRPRWQRKALIGTGALLTAAVVAVVAVVAFTGGSVLPFSGLRGPSGVAVDGSGAVYVADTDNDRVLKLDAGSSSQSVLPFTGLLAPRGVAVDERGAVYVADTGDVYSVAEAPDHDRVLMWAPGADKPSVLPFTGLSRPSGVAVDAAGAVYVADTRNDRVVMLAAGSDTPTVLPFTDLFYPTSVAVDVSGWVYVVDSGHNQVVVLEGLSGTQRVVPLSGLMNPTGVAVDDARQVYVTDTGNRRVVTLAYGSSEPSAKSVASLWSRLPFTADAKPVGVAVDSGAMYISDSDTDQVTAFG